MNSFPNNADIFYLLVASTCWQKLRYVDVELWYNETRENVQFSFKYFEHCMLITCYENANYICYSECFIVE